MNHTSVSSSNAKQFYQSDQATEVKGDRVMQTRDVRADDPVVSTG